MTSKKIIQLIILLFLFSCEQEKELDKIEPEPNTKNLREDYSAVLQFVPNKRKSFYNKEFNKGEIKSYLLQTLSHDIFPAWEGTDWEFNGVTQEPGKGSIACGYFVMTTLEDVGFKVNRVKFAQQASSKIIISLCDQDQVKVFGNKSFEQFYQYVKKSKNELFIVGLDNHVGFVLNEGGKLYAIHSVAWPQDCVVKERLEVAKAFRDSKVHYVGNLLESTVTLKKWRLGEAFILK